MEDIPDPTPFQLPDPTPFQPPTVWPPPEYRTTYRNLGLLLAAKPCPHYENSWGGDILSLLRYVFPATDPYSYVIKPQSNLREPWVPPPGYDDEPSSQESKYSTESHDERTAHGRHSDGPEQRIKRPDFVIDRGIWGAQKMVAIVEMKKARELTPEDRKQFHEYCQRVAQFGADVTAGTSAVLILGGLAYVWNRAQIGQIALAASFVEAHLRLAEKAEVNTQEYIGLLGGVRNRFVAAVLTG